MKAHSIVIVRKIATLLFWKSWITYDGIITCQFGIYRIKMLGGRRLGVPIGVYLIGVLGI